MAILSGFACFPLRARGTRGSGPYGCLVACGFDPGSEVGTGRGGWRRALAESTNLNPNRVLHLLQEESKVPKHTDGPPLEEVAPDAAQQSRSGDVGVVAELVPNASPSCRLVSKRRPGSCLRSSWHAARPIGWL